jgi:hypothetical protein
MGAFKITNLAAGTVASDAARLDQVQGGAATFITVTGTDTLTGTVVPALSAYATGNQFSFLVANTNTGAVTINVDGIGSKAITRTGTTALVAGDMVAGQAVEIIYDGTRFQLVNGNSFTNLKVSGTLGVTGVATFTSLTDSGNLTFTGTGNRITGDMSNATHANRVSFQSSVVNGSTTPFIIPNGTGTIAGIVLANASDPTNCSFGSFSVIGSTDVRFNSAFLGTGTYLPMTFYTGGSERAKIDTSGNVGIGTSSPDKKLQVAGTTDQLSLTTGTNELIVRASSTEVALYTFQTFPMVFYNNNTERMRIDSSGNVGIGTASPAVKLDVSGVAKATTLSISGTTAFSAGTISQDTNWGMYFKSASAAAVEFVWVSSAATERMRIDSSGNVLVTSPAGLGYGTGSGGTVTQATSKSTGVTLNKPTGQITMNNAALLPATSVFFDVNDSLVAATDNVLLTLSNFSALNYTIKCFVATGKFTVVLKNETAGSLSEAVVFNFSIIKGATS